MTSPPSLIASVSGVRGIVGETLTVETALAFARAFGTYVGGQPVAISRDSRPSGEMLYEAVAGGLMSTGSDIYFLSINPTPTVGLAVRRLEAAGGAQITASHNPSEYNGLKLFSRHGTVLSAVEGEQVLRIFRAGQFRTADWRGVGKVRTPTADPMREHIQQVLAQVDHTAISKRRFRVLLDANHGAGGPLALMLLATLGCHPVREGCEPDGAFAHPPEPTEANVASMALQVRTEHCDLGVVLDPDADRLALIDETGRYIGEELTLGLAAAYRMRQTKGPVVVNMSTSRLIEDLANLHGCSLVRAPVGEANVVAKMQKVGAVFGGEGNGGVIDPRVGYVRDPFIGLALVLNLLTETGGKLSQLVAELPRYTIVKDKFAVDASGLPGVYDRLQAQWPEAKSNRDDGLRLDWHDRWVHVRPSNTEPIVRVIAEAPESEFARKLCREVSEAIVAAQSRKPAPRSRKKTEPRPAAPKRRPANRAESKAAVRKRKRK